MGGAAAAVTAPAWLAPVAIGVGIIALSAGIAYVASAVIEQQGAADAPDEGGDRTDESEGLLRLPTDESWGNPSTLDDHYIRHGGDFGAADKDDYAQQASDFLQRSQKAGLPTRIDRKGNIRVYDPKTNEFGSFNPDGTTKTYYRPDPAKHKAGTNQDYWNKQPGQPPWTPKNQK